MMQKSISIIASLLMMAQLTLGQNRYFSAWPVGSSPQEVGNLVAGRFVQSAHPNWGNPGPASEITYPEVCAWYGALLFASGTQNSLLKKALEGRYRVLNETERTLIPLPDHVDHTVFGSISLELYRQTGMPAYLKDGLRYADEQWRLPENPKDAYSELLNKGYSWQTRMWIDDMFMISLVQAQAYRATEDITYINRAAKEMVLYLDELQRPNGLFYHAPDVPYFWGRGNGWMAAGMTELLRSLPVDNVDRPRILEGYKQMMASLLKFQVPDGMWRQLINEETAWEETSATGMFAYAMIAGVRKGWLPEEQYGPAARKAWLKLISYIDETGDISAVCEGTNKKNDKQYYLDRGRKTGDMHGQAPVLWCAFALIDEM